MPCPLPPPRSFTIRHLYERRGAMITIHHLSASRSERIVWLMEELGLEYKLEWFQREPTGAAPQTLKAMHALGKAPLITDDDLLLAESDGIVEHIVSPHAVGRLAHPSPSA